MTNEHEDTCEQCLQPSDDLNDNLVCLDCLFTALDFYEDDY